MKWLNAFSLLLCLLTNSAWALQISVTNHTADNLIILKEDYTGLEKQNDIKNFPKNETVNLELTNTGTENTATAVIKIGKNEENYCQYTITYSRERYTGTRSTPWVNGSPLTTVNGHNLNCAFQDNGSFPGIPEFSSSSHVLKLSFTIQEKL